MGRLSKKAREDQKSKAWELHHQGKTQREISEEIGCHYNTVNKYIKEMREEIRNSALDAKFDTYSVIGESIDVLTSVRKRALKEASETKSASERRKYMDLAVKAEMAKNKLLSDAGMLPAEDPKIFNTVEEDITGSRYEKLLSNPDSRRKILKFVDAVSSIPGAPKALESGPDAIPESA